MSIYEITYIARQEITEQDVEKITKIFTDLASEKGGKVLKTEYWGLREFAYEIKKAKKGHYAHIVVEAASDVVKEVNRQMKLHEDILRELTVVAGEFEEGESAILRKEEFEDKRERRA